MQFTNSGKNARSRREKGNEKIKRAVKSEKRNELSPSETVSRDQDSYAEICPCQHFPSSPTSREGSKPEATQ
uniref:Uncharacterized protein n=1 Tax=Anguilla anguilla TaxID=7936 RepID=A0A0E9R5I4_ANGAN